MPLLHILSSLSLDLRKISFFLSRERDDEDEDDEEKTAERSLPTPVAQQKPRVDDGVVLSFRRRFHQSERFQSEERFCDRFGSGIPFIKVFTVGDTSDIPFEPGERVFARRSGSI